MFRPKSNGPRTALAALLVIGGFAVAAAQDLDVPEAVYPPLPRQAASADGFVPAGWKLEKQISGDLNRDGVADLVLLLRENNPKNIVKHDILGENPFDTNPRILAVAFGVKSGPYALKLENHTLIPRREVPAVEDPLDSGGVAVDSGVLRVKLNFFTSAGSWTTSGTTYWFRYRAGRFVLVGFDRDTLHRGSGETTGISIDYLNGKIRSTSGTMENEEKKVRWTTLRKRTPITIEKIDNGVEYEPQQ